MCSRDREGTANGSVTLSRVSILVGFICALSYFGAFVGTGWVYTKESYRLTNLNLYTSVTFKIGLWRACHSFKRINSTINISPSSCVTISYTNWSQMAIHPVFLRPDMESTISVMSRIRWCAVFVGSGFVLILVGFVCSVAGHFYKDNKTLLASAMYTLSGLSLAAGLFVFVCVLTDSFAIHTATSEEQPWTEVIDTGKNYHNYKYGWCFLVAGALCIFVEMVALLCIAVHHRRCQTIAQIIKNILPVEEQQKAATTTDTSYFSSGDVNYIEKIDACKSENNKVKPNEEPFATSETPPDICSTFLNVEYAEDTGRPCDIKEHSDICSLRMKKGNFATLNTRNYRCLKYPSSLGRRYSTMSGCSSLQGGAGAPDGPSSSSSSSSTRPNTKCHQSASSCIQSTMPRVRNTAAGGTSSTKYATVDRQCKKSEIQAEVQTLDGDNFGL